MNPGISVECVRLIDLQGGRTLELMLELAGAWGLDVETFQKVCHKEFHKRGIRVHTIHTLAEIGDFMAYIRVESVL